MPALGHFWLNVALLVVTALLAVYPAFVVFKVRASKAAYEVVDAHVPEQRGRTLKGRVGKHLQL